VKPFLSDIDFFSEDRILLDKIPHRVNTSRKYNTSPKLVCGELE
jgi:hypothetical protein